MLGNERNIFVLNIMYNCCEHVFFFSIYQLIRLHDIYGII